MTVSQSDVAHLEQQVVAEHARVVDQDRRRAELGGDPRDGGLDLRRVGDVAADREGLAAGRGDLLDGVLAGRLVEVEHGDGAALGGQPYGGGGADAARRAGDDRRRAARWWTCWFSSPLEACDTRSTVRPSVSDRLVPSADVTLEALAPRCQRHTARPVIRRDSARITCTSRSSSRSTSAAGSAVRPVCTGPAGRRCCAARSASGTAARRRRRAACPAAVAAARRRPRRRAARPAPRPRRPPGPARAAGPRRGGCGRRRRTGRGSRRRTPALISSPRSTRGTTRSSAYSKTSRPLRARSLLAPFRATRARSASPAPATAGPRRARRA